MKRYCFHLGLAALVVAAIAFFGTGTAQAAPWSHGHHGHHGHHGGFHPGGFHPGHPGGFHHPPMVIVRPPRPRPPVYIYPRPPYRPGYVTPAAEIAGGVLRIIDGASRW